jgi:CDP-diacylglycerol---serine O-phosphatidyltransferase
VKGILHFSLGFSFCIQTDKCRYQTDIDQIIRYQRKTMPFPESIPPVLYLSILPLGTMFALERFTLHLLSKTPERRAWVRSKPWLHPNFISRCRMPMGVVSVLLYHTGNWLETGISDSLWHHLAVLWFGFWMITDITDGTIARRFNLGSPEGEGIDPLSDKLLVFPPLFYFSWLGLIPLYLVLAMLLFDAIGTISRFFLTNKAANLFGKAKMFLVTMTLVLITLQQIYYPGSRWSITIAMLFCAVFLSFCSVFFKVIPNYWYANILSMLNLLCGLIGIGLVVFYNQIAMAFALVFLGQFLDLFDGRAADRWGSTPKGELFDDLADGTNFGGTISLIIWAAFEKQTLGVILGLLHFCCTVFRLYRFVRDKRRSGTEGGTAVFFGLPSPAAALISGSVSLLDTGNLWRGVVIVLVSLLMISRFRYIHFGRVILPNLPKLLKVLLLTLIILSVWIGFRPGNIQILYWTVFAISTAYLFFGYDWKCYHHLSAAKTK